MKTVTDSYKYNAGEVNLEFSFVKDKKEVQKKRIFVALMKQAVLDLETELADKK